MSDELRPPENCIAHLSLADRMDLLVKLMVAALTLLIFNIGLSVNLRSNLETGLSKLEGRVMVLEEKMKNLEKGD